MISKEQYERLIPYTDDLVKVCQLGYIQGVKGDMVKTVYGVHKELFPSELLQENCGQCVFRVFSKIGKLFLIYKEDNLDKPTEKKKKFKGRPAKRTKK